jgi:hypothetical protein
VSVLHIVVTVLLALTSGAISVVTMLNLRRELVTKRVDPATVKVATVGVVCSLLTIFMAGHA